MAEVASPKAWKFIFEVRYPASARLFDRRGLLMEEFQSEPFTEWRVQRNRVDLHNKENSISVFAAFRNAGGVAEDPPTFTYFRDHLHRWLRLVMRELRITRIERIGFRTLYLAPVSSSSFESLFEDFVQNYLGGNSGLLGSTSVRPVDVGIVLDFHVDGCKLHMTTGPMEQKQAQDHFDSVGVREKLPSLSIFADLDYFADNPDFEEARIVQMCMRFVAEANQKIEAHVREFLQKFAAKEGE